MQAIQKINSAASLREAILQLEIRQANEGIILREQFRVAFESVKPINLIKNTLKEAASSGDLKENMLNTSFGLTAGYLSKIIFQGVSNNPLKRLLGSALMFGITNIVSKNPETVKSLGMKFLKIIRKQPGGGVNGKDNEENVTLTPSENLK